MMALEWPSLEPTNNLSSKANVTQSSYMALIALTLSSQTKTNKG
jgi:hypothetical protein